MTETASTGLRSQLKPRFAPVPPRVAIVPGVMLVLIGGWVAGGGGIAAAWICLTVGLTLLVTGAVAAGVAWGLALHDERSA